MGPAEPGGTAGPVTSTFTAAEKKFEFLDVIQDRTIAGGTAHRHPPLCSGDPGALFIRVHPCSSVSNDPARRGRKIIGLGTVAIEHG